MFKGKLDKVAGEQLLGTLRALAAKQRTTAAVAGVEVSRNQAHADALVSLVEHYGSCGLAPRYGADRPRILVSIDYDPRRATRHRHPAQHR